MLWKAADLWGELMLSVAIGIQMQQVRSVEVGAVLSLFIG